jgi:AraC-like DNA-binding protein
MVNKHCDDAFADLLGEFSVAYSETEKSPLTKFHVHDAYEITLILSDDVVLDVNNESYSVPRGSLLVFNTMDLHCVKYSGSDKYKRWVVWFKRDFLNVFDHIIYKLFRCFYVRGGEKNNILTLSEQQLECALEKYRQMKEASLSQGYMKEELIKMLLGEFLIFVNGVYLSKNDLTRSLSATEYSAVYQAILYIRENYSKKLSRDDVAKFIGIDKRRLCECFKNITGLTTVQFILDFRITVAKNLLLQGYSVAEVCEKTGFENWSNFSRTFSTHVGLSPKQFAMKHKNG